MFRLSQSPVQIENAAIDGRNFIGRSHRRPESSGDEVTGGEIMTLL